jgi:hypothetical protein
VFDYIEMFYNPKRRHGFNNQLSPVEFENPGRFSAQSCFAHKPGDHQDCRGGAAQS